MHNALSRLAQHSYPKCSLITGSEPRRSLILFYHKLIKKAELLSVIPIICAWWRLKTVFRIKPLDPMLLTQFYRCCAHRNLCTWRGNPPVRNFGSRLVRTLDRQRSVKNGDAQITGITVNALTGVLGGHIRNSPSLKILFSQSRENQSWFRRATTSR